MFSKQWNDAFLRDRLGKGVTVPTVLYKVPVLPEVGYPQKNL